LLTPMEIHNHQFKKSFRGYNENEVDDFLDRVVADFEKLLGDRDRFKNQVESLGKEVEQYRKLEKTLNDTLMVAQRTADEVISSAKKNAENLKENTARECQNIRDQAQFEAKQLVDNATAKRDEILTEYNRLVREKHEFLLKLRTTLESELAITNQTLNAVPQVEEPPARPKTVTEIFQNPAAVEVPAPVEKPVEVPAAEEISEPVEKIPSAVEETPSVPADATQNTKIVDISVKPSQKTAEVSDDTIVYKPAKKDAPKNEEAANS